MTSIQLHFIIGHSNVQNWIENEIQDVNLNRVYKKTFSSLSEKKAFIDGLYFGGTDNYQLIDEDEYKLLMY